MLFWALLAAGQITMRKVDGWQTLTEKLADKPIDLAARSNILTPAGDRPNQIPTQIATAPLPQRTTVSLWSWARAASARPRLPLLSQ